MTASAGCRRSRFCRGIQRPASLLSNCPLDGGSLRTFIPDQWSFGSITFNRVTSDNSLPSNEPIVVDPGSGEFRLLHDVDSDFTRLSNLNFPNTYHQEETRATFNYIRQLSDRVSLTELFCVSFPPQ